MLWWVCALSAWAIVIGAVQLAVVLARRTGGQEVSFRSDTNALWDHLPGVEVVDEPGIPLFADWYPDHRLTAAYRSLVSALPRRHRPAA